MSKVTIARPNSTSLRTTIPEGIVKLLDLKTGDSLKWNVNAKGSKLTLSVTKG